MPRPGPIHQLRVSPSSRDANGQNQIDATTSTTWCRRHRAAGRKQMQQDRLIQVLFLPFIKIAIGRESTAPETDEPWISQRFPGSADTPGGNLRGPSFRRRRDDVQSIVPVGAGALGSSPGSGSANRPRPASAPSGRLVVWLRVARLCLDCGSPRLARYPDCSSGRSRISRWVRARAGSGHEPACPA